MDQSDVRQDQVRTICEFVAETRDRREFPPVLCGDFNAVPDSEEIRMLTGLTTVPVPKLVFIDAWRAAGDGVGTTWDNRNGFAAEEYEPDGRIDYVFVGYRVMSASATWKPPRWWVTSPSTAYGRRTTSACPPTCA